MVSYIDESGDLGWKFDMPNRAGGSSRYLTIAYLILPKEQIHIPTRLIKKVYNKYKLDSKIEKKGAGFTDKEASYIADLIINMLNTNDRMTISCITIKKENVHEHIREDQNVIYNYSLVLSFAKRVKDFKAIKIIPDKRSVKINKGDQIDNYLKTKLWMELGSKVLIEYEPRESHSEENLWLIDWIANFTWRHYEDNRSDAFIKLSKRIIVDSLYF
jgi:hypothetical protein